MARGWESKSVDDQIGAAEAERSAPLKPVVSSPDRETKTRIESLRLSRARMVGLLEVARSERYRAQLRRTIAALDSQLAELQSTESSN